MSLYDDLPPIQSAADEKKSNTGTWSGRNADEASSAGNNNHSQANFPVVGHVLLAKRKRVGMTPSPLVRPLSKESGGKSPDGSSATSFSFSSFLILNSLCR